jgi:tRNA(fMet)-specific endonuclease VapC
LNRYLLDTNHLSAYVDRQPGLVQKINKSMRAGDRFGICLPVICEYRAGIRLSRRFKQNLARLSQALALIRLWPMDAQAAAEFGDMFWDLRSKGKTLGPFDLLIASVAVQQGLTLLTADRDFNVVTQLRQENWL